jgi:hypothetical protein
VSIEARKIHRQIKYFPNPQIPNIFRQIWFWLKIGWNDNSTVFDHEKGCFKEELLLS